MGMRASDADRERTAAQLREHYGAGRLSDDELGARLEDAYRARTVDELQLLTLDLPQPGSTLPERRRPAPVAQRRSLTRGGRALRTSLRIHLAVYVLVNVLLIAIWAAAGGGYFWPVWPILGWGMGVAGHAAPVMAGVGRRRSRSAGRIAAPSSIDDVAASVGTARPSLRPAAAPDGTVTILFSDIAGSTEINDRLGDLRWLELLRAHHAIVRDAVREHGGYEVKAQGDGFMIAFPSARAAVHCALTIQRAIGTALGDHPEGPVRVRVGLHTGEAIREQDDFYGRNVVLAARIAAEAQAGEILASAVVRELAASMGDVTFGPPQVVELKGLGAQTVHRVEP